MAFDFMQWGDELGKDVVEPPVDPFVDKNGVPLNQGAPAQPRNPPRAPRVIRPQGSRVQGAAPMDFASLGPAGQSYVLNDMTNGVNDLVNREMDSRVAQAREARQQEHERQMMAMQMQARNQRDEGDIIRSLLAG